MIFTLCALSVDRFLATFHQLGRYRQIRVGVAICASIWLVCLAVSSPYWIFGLQSYWIFGSTVERTRRRPTMVAAATGSDVIIAQTGNVTAHTLNNDTLFDHLQLSPTSDLDMELELVNAYDLDTNQKNDLNRDLDLDPEICRHHDFFPTTLTLSLTVALTQITKLTFNLTLVHITKMTLTQTMTLTQKGRACALSWCRR